MKQGKQRLKSNTIKGFYRAQLFCILMSRAGATGGLQIFQPTPSHLLETTDLFSNNQNIYNYILLYLTIRRDAAAK